jgi:hypothetical protein
MATSVNLPKALLNAVEQRAKVLRLSRDHLIVRALERELRESSDWSPGFFERLERPEPQMTDLVDEMLAAVRGARSSKAPRRL